MRMLWLSIFGLITTTVALAQSPQVQVVNPDIKASDFPNTVKIHPPAKGGHMVPAKEKREKFFAQFPGAKPHMEDWDELQKDLFWLHLRTKEPPELKKKYPGFPETQLKQMREAARG